jgi:hypothetical protein
MEVEQLQAALEEYAKAQQEQGKTLVTRLGQISAIQVAQSDALQQAYLALLLLDRFQGRGTASGQTLMSNLRDAIASDTGETSREVQDRFYAMYIKVKYDFTRYPQDKHPQDEPFRHICWTDFVNFS